MHNDEVHSFCFPQNIVRSMRRAWNVTCLGEMASYREVTTRTRKEDVKMNLEESELEVLDLVNLINYRDQWRVIVDIVMNLPLSSYGSKAIWTLAAFSVS
jgi:hypothetical protein